MKRFFSALLIFVCLFLLFSCSQKNKILIAGYSEGGSFLSSVREDIDLNFHQTTERSGGKEYEAIINGEKIVGQYESSRTCRMFNCDADVYRGIASDGAEVRFWINRSTKKLVVYSVFHDEDYQTAEDGLDRDECLRIAEGVLAAFDERGQYRLKTESDDRLKDLPGFGYVYSFYFIKTALEKDTAVFVNITVNTDGLVVDFSAQFSQSMDENDIERLKNHKPDEAAIDREIKDTVVSYLAPEYKDSAELTNVGLSYLKLDDGHIYARHEIEIKLPDKSYADRMSLLRRID